MMTTINVSLNVPPAYKLDVLTRQLTEYGERLVANNAKTMKKAKHYRHESLRGLMKGIDATPEELINEYLEEKYHV